MLVNGHGVNVRRGGRLWSVMNQPGMMSLAGRGGVRIGNAERERAAVALGEHFADGRLDADEYDDRVRRAYAAKTAGELAMLFGDLPTLQRPGYERARGGRRSGSPVGVMVLLVLVASALWVLTVHMPPFFVVPLVGFIAVRRLIRLSRTRA